MEKVPPSEQVSSAVKQHAAMQENFEAVLKTSPNPPSYAVATDAKDVQYGMPYGGQYDNQYGVNPAPVVSRELNVTVGQAPQQQVSIVAMSRIHISALA